jgi:hypothetical protein
MNGNARHPQELHAALTPLLEGYPDLLEEHKQLEPVAPDTKAGKLHEDFMGKIQGLTPEEQAAFFEKYFKQEFGKKEDDEDATAGEVFGMLDAVKAESKKKESTT